MYFVTIVVNHKLKDMDPGHSTDVKNCVMRNADMPARSNALRGQAADLGIRSSNKTGCYQRSHEHKLTTLECHRENRNVQAA